MPVILPFCQTVDILKSIHQTRVLKKICSVFRLTTKTIYKHS